MKLEKLDPAIDLDHDRILGPVDAGLTLVEYGSYACEQYQRALDAGRVEQDIPVNHSEFFAPVIEPTLSNGTRALVVAALTYLAK
jgi:hypothetical protein